MMDKNSKSLPPSQPPVPKVVNELLKTPASSAGTQNVSKSTKSSENKQKTLSVPPQLQQTVISQLCTPLVERDSGLLAGEGRHVTAAGPSYNPGDYGPVSGGPSAMLPGLCHSVEGIKIEGGGFPLLYQLP